MAKRRNETVFEYWISLWPVAPFFGVPWRFEKMMPGAAFFRPSEVAARMAEGVAGEASKAADEALDRIVRDGDRVRAAAKANGAAPAPAVEPEAPAASPVEPAAPAAEPVEAAYQVVEAEAEAEAEAALESDAEAMVRPASLYAEAPAETDDLKQIKGVGPKLEKLLNELGVYRFEQIAAFTEAELAWVDQHLATFKGRPVRDDWRAQARALA